jgi:hypothetical protein
MTNKTFAKIVAMPVVAAGIFTGLTFFQGNDSVVASTTDFDAAFTNGVATADYDTAYNDVTYSDSHEVEYPVYSEMPEELTVALADLEHSIAMADEVRIAMHHRVITWQNGIARGVVGNISQVESDQHNADRKLRDSIVDAITETEVQKATFLYSSENAESLVQQLNELRKHLMSIYEPNGPFENPFGFPSAWLSVLPNGDPRNLPWREMGSAVSMHPIGPEVVQTVFSPGSSFPGNRGEAPDSPNLRYPVAIWPSVLCYGPSLVFQNTGGCLPRTNANVTPGNIAHQAIMDYTLFNYFNPERNRMEQLTSAVREERDGSLSPVSRCVSANLNRNSDLVDGNFDFERDSDGFIVFRPMPECVTSVLVWGPLVTNGWINNGHEHARWDSIYEGPSIWNQPQIFAPFERSEPNVLRQRSMDDPELSAIITELETPEGWAAAIQAERDLAQERGFLADFDAALERGWGPILQDGRPLWLPGEFETIKDGWARLDMLAETSRGTVPVLAETSGNGGEMLEVEAVEAVETGPIWLRSGKTANRLEYLKENQQIDERFVGRWETVQNGINHVWEFSDDGSVSIETISRDGILSTWNGIWSFRDDTLEYIVNWIDGYSNSEINYTPRRFATGIDSITDIELILNSGIDFMPVSGFVMSSNQFVLTRIS